MCELQDRNQGMLPPRPPILTGRGEQNQAQRAAVEMLLYILLMAISPTCKLNCKLQNCFESKIQEVPLPVIPFIVLGDSKLSICRSRPCFAESQMKLAATIGSWCFWIVFRWMEVRTSASSVTTWVHYKSNRVLFRTCGIARTDRQHTVRLQILLQPGSKNAFYKRTVFWFLSIAWLCENSCEQWDGAQRKSILQAALPLHDPFSNKGTVSKTIKNLL